MKLGRSLSDIDSLREVFLINLPEVDLTYHYHKQSQ